MTGRSHARFKPRRPATGGGMSDVSQARSRRVRGSERHVTVGRRVCDEGLNILQQCFRVTDYERRRERREGLKFRIRCNIRRKSTQEYSTWNDT